MKLIKKIHDLIDLAINKGYTQYLSRPQIDSTIYFAEVDLFKKLLQTVPRTKRERNYLRPFEVSPTGELTFTDGVATLPAGFEHEIAFATEDEHEVEIIESGFWEYRVNDPIAVPTVTKPIVTFRSNKVLVRPKTVTKLFMQSYRLPVQPEYKTQEVNGMLVYDDTTSVDVEFSALLHDIIIAKTLEPLGLSLREGQVIQTAQMMERKEAKV